MTNTAIVTKALRSAGFQVTTDLPGTVKVKKTRFQEQNSVTVKYITTGSWSFTTNWKTKNEEVFNKLIQLGFNAIMTENDGIEVKFAKQDN